METIQEIRAKTILLPVLPNISPFFKKMPAPMEEPITKRTAEKKVIFFFVTSPWATFFPFLFITFILYLYNIRVKEKIKKKRGIK